MATDMNRHPNLPMRGRDGTLGGRKLKADDDLAVHVPAGLELDRGADLPDRESCRDGHAELARRDQAGDLLDGAGGGVSAVGRRDPVDLCSDGGDAFVRHAEFWCRLRRLRPVQVDGRGDAGGSQGAEPAGQAVAVGDRLGPEGTQGTGRRRRSVPITRAPESRASCTANTPTRLPRRR